MLAVYSATLTIALRSRFNAMAVPDDHDVVEVSPDSVGLPCGRDTDVLQSDHRQNPLSSDWFFFVFDLPLYTPRVSSRDVSAPMIVPRLLSASRDCRQYTAQRLLSRLVSPIR